MSKFIKLLPALLIFLLLTFLLQTSPIQATGTNVAPAGSITATSSLNATQQPQKLLDGNQVTIWESNHILPASVTVTLTQTYVIDQIKLKLPDDVNYWGGRNQTIQILGSSDGTNFTQIVAPTSYFFSNGAASVKTINFTPVNYRHIKVTVSTNSQTDSSQLSELEIYGVVPATPTPSPTPSPTPVPTTWPIQSFDVMKYSKDVVCAPPSDAFIATQAKRAKDGGANYIAISTPYDDPSCASALTLTNKWIAAIRAENLKVWHRHMGLSFEGIYSTPKAKALNAYTQQIVGYIYMNQSQFEDGDLFTPTPEPDSAGINGVTYCGNPALCAFSSSSEYNLWIQKTQTAVKAAFADLGKNVKVGYYGHSGFIVWGENNPDWQGQSFLTQATVTSMDNVITMDTYPESYSGGTMAASLNGAHTKWPSATIVIGEWGTITATNSAQAQSQINASMGASKPSVRSYVTGFNYWHLGPGGNEGLLNNDQSIKPQYTDVSDFYHALR